MDLIDASIALPHSAPLKGYLIYIIQRGFNGAPIVVGLVSYLK